MHLEVPMMILVMVLLPSFTLDGFLAFLMLVSNIINGVIRFEYATYQNALPKS